jgi:glycosyltransferase involved in cell wall biosynthesis
VFVQSAAGIHTVLAALIARLLDRRFVYASAGVHDFDFGTWERRRSIVWLYGLAVRSADEVVVQTPEQVRLCRARFGREPVLIRSIAEPAASHAEPREAFLWIGRLTTHKQPLIYAALARAVPEAHFRMVAVGSPDSAGSRLGRALERAAEELPNLELLAPRARAELAPLVERAVAIVNTSWSEGMPNVFLEGWSRGVPALALTHDPDGVIERERLGAYASGSVARLVELARAMWVARADQDELAARCRHYVARDHALAPIADCWVRLLKLDA